MTHGTESECATHYTTAPLLIIKVWANYLNKYCAYVVTWSREINESSRVMKLTSRDFHVVRLPRQVVIHVTLRSRWRLNNDDAVQLCSVGLPDDWWLCCQKVCNVNIIMLMGYRCTQFKIQSLRQCVSVINDFMRLQCRCGPNNNFHLGFPRLEIIGQANMLMTQLVVGLPLHRSVVSPTTAPFWTFNHQVNTNAL